MQHTEVLLSTGTVSNLNVIYEFSVKWKCKPFIQDLQATDHEKNVLHYINGLPLNKAFEHNF